jgi:hypothetical protein
MAVPPGCKIKNKNIGIVTAYRNFLPVLRQGIKNNKKSIF